MIIWDTARVLFENISLREVFGLVSVHRAHRGDADRLNFCRPAFLTQVEGPALLVTSIPRRPDTTRPDYRHNSNDFSP